MSISIDRETLLGLNEMQRRLGFKSRSKMLQNAVLGMLKEYQAVDALTGTVESVFVLTYKKSEKNHVSDMLHRFDELVRTELHQHNSNVCVDVIDVKGSAARIKDFFGALKRSKCIHSVTYSIVSGNP